MNHSQKTLYECCRLLMAQVEEEKHSRQVLIRALMTEDAKPRTIPTDEEVDARIAELISVQEVKSS